MFFFSDLSAFRLSNLSQLMRTGSSARALFGAVHPRKYLYFRWVFIVAFTPTECKKLIRLLKDIASSSDGLFYD
jgi:hypothetical protein